MQYCVSVRSEGHGSPPWSECTSTSLPRPWSPPPQDWEQRPQVLQLPTTQSTGKKSMHSCWCWFLKIVSFGFNQLKSSVYIPGQGCWKHGRLSTRGYRHCWLMAGTVTCRFLVSVPFPQVTLQFSQGPQSLTLQATGFVMIVFKLFNCCFQNN